MSDLQKQLDEAETRLVNELLVMGKLVHQKNRLDKDIEFHSQRADVLSNECSRLRAEKAAKEQE